MYIYIYVYIYIYRLSIKIFQPLHPNPNTTSGHQAERRGARAGNSNGKAETSVELAEAPSARSCVRGPHC